ncbi:propionate-CoA ligase [Capsaspora owczarzaki ATCC 30864]|uniref:Propionate-CoA ligase n=1 Tax=Capsaspora owczarzaki (strain ATCC 30864) TaxID=595528 RepID=A0A0D2VFE1_CAPO3|nr:propionate-CoA ligase [Capsaspora owczarzaki ATCC 30864]
MWRAVWSSSCNLAGRLPQPAAQRLLTINSNQLASNHFDYQSEHAPRIYRGQHSSAHSNNHSNHSKHTHAKGNLASTPVQPLVQAHSKSALDRVIHDAAQHPDAFWLRAANHSGLHWSKPPTIAKVLNPNGTAAWFPDGELNTCYNAIDVHVEQHRGAQVALIHDSPVTKSVTNVSYTELQERVATFAGVLARHGVGMGDRVLIYMPMVPEAAISMLACARLGAIHSVVFGGFASHELATRISDCQPSVIITGSCGIEGAKIIPYKPLLDRAIDLATHKPNSVIVFQRPMSRASLVSGKTPKRLKCRDYDWTAEVEASQPHACVPVPSQHPLYILYTSGTTGAPKGIVRESGPHAVAIKWSMTNIYGLRPGETMFAGSDIGWVVGSSYVCYGPLLNGNTTVLFEGKPVGTPDPSTYWRIVDQHNVNVMFTSPTALRAIKREQSDKLVGGYDTSRLRSLFVAGEHCDTDTLKWIQQMLQKPVIDHWWQTETGWPMASLCPGIQHMPVRAGSAGKPVPGYTIHILDQKTGQVLPEPNTLGAIAVKLPMPPGVVTTLWNNQKRFDSTYLSSYPGYYDTGDAGYFDEDGYLYVMARTDDVINVAGHRLSTSALEDVICSHPAVAECAVVGVKDRLKGQLPIGLVILKQSSASASQSLSHDLQRMVADQVGAFACYKNTIVVEKLPKTRSGKILRKTIRQMANHEKVDIPATIEDAAVLPVIQQILHDASDVKPPSSHH